MKDQRDVWRSEASWHSHRDAQRTARASLAEPASVPLVILPSMAQSVNITELSLPQLEVLKNQLDQVGTAPETPLSCLTSLLPTRTPSSPIPPHFGRFPSPASPQRCPRAHPFSSSGPLSLQPLTLFPFHCRKWSSCPRPLPSSRWYRPNMWKPRTV